MNRDDKLAEALRPILMAEENSTCSRYENVLPFAGAEDIAAWLRSEEGIAALAADDVIREGIARQTSLTRRAEAIGLRGSASADEQVDFVSERPVSSP